MPKLEDGVLFSIFAAHFLSPHPPHFLFLCLSYFLPFAGTTSSKTCTVTNAASTRHVHCFLRHAPSNPQHTLPNHKAKVVVPCLTDAEAPQNNWSQGKMSLTQWKLRYSVPRMEKHICEEVGEAAPNQSTSRCYWASQQPRHELRAIKMISISWGSCLWVTSWPNQTSIDYLFYVGLFLLELRYYQCETLLWLLIW